MLVRKLVLAVAVGVGVLGAAGLGWYGWAAARADDTAAKTDKDKVQGKWKITAAVVQGRRLPPERVAGVLGGDTMEFKGDKVAVRAEMTFTLDTSKSPKRIDMSPADKKGPVVGVYALDGDKLTLHYAAPGSADRPTEVEFKPGMNTTRLVLERVKE